ncbi:tripartite tricarboxylate transporter substrate binding protein [Bordetella sp. BOR01]|uniref:Bug family tripartite tricarboxylate transporter substrate binding protein n=1 Tax=Bordetella sp. BOR01 TaxID=2854779 RepID=UPI001C43D5F1|nr:tripartite tricarboxylate transporter substrate binding protein [Bordetella sp. BOR01]MBV7481388.1 tripartite tricarboxylate transporter substrate binding protein [Bordetella sp. BOR01]
MISRRSFLKLTYGSALVAGSFLGRVQASSGPVSIVIPGPPGGGADAIARIVADKLGAKLNETVIVEARPGASGLIASNYVRRQAPDGRVLYLSSSMLVTAPAVNPEIQKLDPVADFTPLARLSVNTYLFLANKNLPVSDIREFIEYCRANPGKVKIGTVGQGSSSHLAAAYLAKAANIDVIIVHYKGSAPANQDMMGGFVDAKFENLAGTRAALDSGKVRILGVSNEQRSPLFPDVPAVNEVVPGLAADDFFVIVAPKGMDKEQAQALSRHLGEVVQMPDVQMKLRDQLGAISAPLDPERTAEYMRASFSRTKDWAADLHVTT